MAGNCHVNVLKEFIVLNYYGFYLVLVPCVLNEMS